MKKEVFPRWSKYFQIFDPVIRARFLCGEFANVQNARVHANSPNAKVPARAPGLWKIRIKHLFRKNLDRATRGFTNHRVLIGVGRNGSQRCLRLFATKLGERQNCCPAGDTSVVSGVILHHID